MYDIEELENRWLRYKRKYLLKFATILLGLFVSIALVLWLTQRGEQEKGDRSEPKEKKESVAKESKRTDSKRKRVEALKTEVPSMKTRESKEPRRKREVVSSISDDVVLYRGGKVIQKSKAKTKKLELEIVEPSDKKIVKEIEDRFKTSKSYDDAIYLAEYYYNRKNYKKAIEWAKEANTIDSLPEESWMIFCKAKAKDGHRVEALKVLDIYYKRTGSTAAFNLMDLIRKNLKF